MHTGSNESKQSRSDWEDRVDDSNQSQAGGTSDIDAFVEDTLDFAREMVECALVPLRDLIANPPPPFGRRLRHPRAPWAGD